MAREISRAEAWERAHEVFSKVNFNAFDFNTIKESLIDYVKLYFPEDFNDYIESSEFIAILELFAYVGELLAYRIDLNAHENFITTAERKESILRLAKLISYKASRNIPARGLVKMTSIQTTENVIDSQGRNLAGRRIYWNDRNNNDWKEQFILILNRALEQEYGTVNPDERVQVNDVLFELYTFDNNPFGTGTAGTVPFSADVNGTTAPMEIVPLELTSSGPQERRPEVNAKFSVVYANDGLGDGSDTTGFLMFTKQGSLQRIVTSFDGVTPNQTYEILVDNINETDVWLNNVDSQTGEILVNDPYADLIPHLVSNDLLYGEWIEVDLANAQNIIFNTNSNRHKYEIETLDNDQVRIIFGDGEFSDIPGGTFHIWYRTSLNDDYTVEKSSVINKSGSISYTDVTGNIQTISFTFSLVSSLQNASASEDIEHIRRVAPSVYYTQDRMVNGRDYNTFMLQDPSILKLRAINRTFAGDSKYIAWHDPRENYEDVKIFGDDLALYWVENDPLTSYSVEVSVSTDSQTLLNNYIEPLLASNDFFDVIAPQREALGLAGGEIRTVFSSDPYSFGTDVNGQTNEIDAITYVLDNFTTNVEIYYNIVDVSGTLIEEWTVGQHPGGTAVKFSSPMIVIDQQFGQWIIYWRERRLVAQSVSTLFWNTNTTDQIINFDTLNSRGDTVIVLKANENANRDGLLTNNHNFAVLAQELVDNNAGNLPDNHKLSVIPEDVNGDGIPDNMLQPNLFDLTITGTWGDLKTDEPAYPGVYYIDLAPYNRKINNSSPPKGLDSDISVYNATDDVFYTYDDASLVIHSAQSTDLFLDRVYLATPYPDDTDNITITLKDYVYFYRTQVHSGEQSAWAPQTETETLKTNYLSEDHSVPETEWYYQRYAGRYPLNFAWFHYTPSLNLVDPAASNIIDIYIITKGYYTSLTRWLSNKTDTEPSAPTPLELRSTYATLLDNKMISDTVILHPGSFKILFGSRAIPQLQAIFKVIRPSSSSLTDNQVKVRIVDTVRSFFDVNAWEFGETFFFSELTASIHSVLGPEIDSVVLVPSYSQNFFGDLYQVFCKEDEIFIPDISTSNIEIVTSYTAENIRQV